MWMQKKTSACGARSPRRSKKSHRQGAVAIAAQAADSRLRLIATGAADTADMTLTVGVNQHLDHLAAALHGLAQRRRTVAHSGFDLFRVLAVREASKRLFEPG